MSTIVRLLRYLSVMALNCLKYDMNNFTQKVLITLVVVFFTNAIHAMPREEARHMLTRTGFGANFDEISRYSKLSYKQAVEQLLNEVNEDLVIQPPAWLHKPIAQNNKKFKQLLPEQKKAIRKKRKMQESQLKGWWLAEMANTESPFTEKMVLFWHNHFTSSLKKVKQPVLLYRQNELFRKHALGNYKELVHAISKDPAMLGYLDNFKSTKKSPNENFARELLELFTLGEGNYSEQDIKQAARAFTGWSVDRKTGKYVFRKARHDFGEKTFLGEQGKLNGDDIIDIIFQQPEVATFLVNKLWLEFVSETPNEAEIQYLAEYFRNNNYELKLLMRELLLSKSFRSSSNYARLIKSPIDYIVGTLRMLEIPVKDGRAAAFASAHLGQNVFDPPNVKGWSGGKDWITSSSLLTRQQLLERMFRGKAAGSNKQKKLLDRKFDMQKMLNSENQKVDLQPFLENIANKYSKLNILELLLADKPIDTDLAATNEAKFNIDELMRVMSDPVYQLK